MPPPRTYAEFWPYFLSEHRHPSCRTLHLVGLGLAFALLGTAINLGRFWPFIAALVVSQVFAWAGHLLFEKKRPTFLAHPWWSLRADFQMFAWAITGRLGPELRRLGLDELSRRSPKD